jgi:hypothetical protein
MPNPLQPITRFFSGDKVLESRPLNFMGAQVMRAMLARGLYNMRPNPVAPALREQAVELQREGLLILPDFLPLADYAAVRAEAMSLLDHPDFPIKTLNHGPNRLDLVNLKAADWEKLPHIGKLYTDERLVELMQVGEKRRLTAESGSRAFEHLTQGPLGESEDPETELHSDIFFNTHKSWYYLEDVNLENGPLVAVKRSHRLSFGQLNYLYQESTSNNKGSRRITAEELQKLGLSETILTVPKNTLVIANTCGYHRRVRGVPGKERFALHWTLRANPFRILR